MVKFLYHLCCCSLSLFESVNNLLEMWYTVLRCGHANQGIKTNCAFGTVLHIQLSNANLWVSLSVDGLLSIINTVVESLSFNCYSYNWQLIMTSYWHPYRYFKNAIWSPTYFSMSSQDLITHFLIIVTVFLRICSCFSESFITKKEKPAVDVGPDKCKIMMQNKSLVILKPYFRGCSLQFHLVFLPLYHTHPSY